MRRFIHFKGRMGTLLPATMGLFAVAFAAAPQAFGQRAAGEPFPTRPIEITVTFAPGGTPDILARALSEGLSEELGQSVVVVNKLGAGGAIGAAAVSRARPDGHALLFAPALVQSVAPLVQGGANYQP